MVNDQDESKNCKILRHFEIDFVPIRGRSRENGYAEGVVAWERPQAASVNRVRVEIR